jgi:hypothetical protein
VNLQRIGGHTKRAHRHHYGGVLTPQGMVYDPCACGKVRDDAAIRRARLNGKRGRAIQRKRIEGLGGKNLSGNNENLDGISAMFAFESKSTRRFPGSWWGYLKGIPHHAGQTQVLIVTEAPGSGRKARSIVVIDYDDWRALHGGTP